MPTTQKAARKSITMRRDENAQMVASSVTRLYHVGNTHIRDSFKVRPISDKLRESNMRWYGHVMRRPSYHMTRKVSDIEINPRTRKTPNHMDVHSK